MVFTALSLVTLGAWHCEGTCQSLPLTLREVFTEQSLKRQAAGLLTLKTSPKLASLSFWDQILEPKPYY